jgi:hypothetical protein
VSTTEKTGHPYGGATRAIIGWLDDKDAANRSVRVSLDDSDAVIDVLPDILGCYTSSQDLATHRAGAPAVGSGMVISGIDLPPYFADEPTELAAARTRNQIREYNTALAGLWISDLAASHGVMMFGSAVSSEAQASGVKPMRAFVFPGVAVETLGRHCDFHSSSEGALSDITRIIGSVFSDWREALSTCLDDDSEPTAYTDDAGDYPPLARNYVDVKVLIHGA